MSFDIYMMFFRGGEPTRIPRTVVARAFGAVADTSDPGGWWDIKDSSAVLLAGEEDEIEFLSVNRPPYAEHPFWSALIDFLRETGGVLFWPGGGQVVTDQAAAAQLPPKMIEILGPPIVADSAEAIFKVIVDS